MITFLRPFRVAGAGQADFTSMYKNQNATLQGLASQRKIWPAEMFQESKEKGFSEGSQEA